MIFREIPVTLLGIIIYLIYTFCLSVIKRRSLKSLNFIREGVKLLFLIYIFMVASVTLFPLYIGGGYPFSFRSINLIPLASIFGEISQVGKSYDGDADFMIQLIVRNVGGNILLLMPLGFFAPILWKRFKKLKRVFLLGLLVSVSIECLQLVELVIRVAFARAVDIDDVICNVLGTVIGYVMYKGLTAIWRRFKNKSGMAAVS